jgi:4-amino-4-deoxy-L-arabinose transferase-like glycosyltransferase
LPWVLLLPGLVRQLLRRGRRAAQRRPAALGLVLASFVWMLLFFSLAGCKRPSYLLPTLPPLALALGWYIHLQAPAWPRLVWRGSRLATATAGLALVAGAGVAVAAAWAHLVRPPSGLLMALTGLGGLLLVAMGRRRLSWAACGVVVLALSFAGVQQLLPAYNDQFALRGQLRRQARQADGSRRPVVCYPTRYDSLSFYLPRSRVRVFGRGQKRDLIAHLKSNPDTLVLIKSGSSLKEVLHELPPGVRLDIRQPGGAITVGRVVHLEDELGRRLAGR